MSSSNQGRQSPTPDSQSDAQTGRTAGGQGVNDNSNNQQQSKDQLAVSPTGFFLINPNINQSQGLSSNPKPILEDHLKDATKKTEQQKKD